MEPKTFNIDASPAKSTRLSKWLIPLPIGILAASFVFPNSNYPKGELSQHLVAAFLTAGVLVAFTTNLLLGLCFAALCAFVLGRHYPQMPHKIVV
jgi:hypothetical protein